MHHEDIKAAMRKRGVMPSALARHLEVSPTTVSAVIRGTVLSARVADAIAKITGLSVAQLWPGKYDDKPAGANVAELLGAGLRENQRG